MLSTILLTSYKMTREQWLSTSLKAPKKSWSVPALSPGQHSGSQLLIGSGLPAKTPRKNGVLVNPELGILTCPNQPGYEVYGCTAGVLKKSSEQGGGSADVLQGQKKYSEMWSTRHPYTARHQPVKDRNQPLTEPRPVQSTVEQGWQMKIEVADSAKKLSVNLIQSPNSGKAPAGLVRSIKATSALPINTWTIYWVNNWIHWEFPTATWDIDKVCPCQFWSATNDPKMTLNSASNVPPPVSPSPKFQSISLYG